MCIELICSNSDLAAVVSGELALPVDQWARDRPTLKVLLFGQCNRLHLDALLSTLCVWLKSRAAHEGIALHKTIFILRADTVRHSWLLRTSNSSDEVCGMDRFRFPPILPLMEIEEHSSIIQLCHSVRGDEWSLTAWLHCCAPLELG